MFHYFPAAICSLVVYTWTCIKMVDDRENDGATCLWWLDVCLSHRCEVIFFMILMNSQVSQLIPALCPWMTWSQTKKLIQNKKCIIGIKQKTALLVKNKQRFRFLIITKELFGIFKYLSSMVLGLCHVIDYIGAGRESIVRFLLMSDHRIL